jgi:hypothetical protein
LESASTKKTILEMKTEIAFASPEEIAASRLYSVTKPQSKPAYDDLILLPEYQSRKFIFPMGKTCSRILPQLAGTAGWMHEIEVLNHPNGQHLHPKSFKGTGKTKGSVFDISYSWLRANMPDTLYSKANPKGFRLLPTKMAICYLLVEIDGKMQAKLFVGSSYDGGTAGGNCGVAHQLFKVASEINQPGGHDATHAEHGVQIVVEKTTPHGAKYPSYKMTRANVETPISRYLERMDESELEAIRPLHEVLRRVEQVEEWALLAKVIGEELRDKIRNSTAKPQSTSSAKPEPVSLAANEPSPVSEESPTVDDAPSDIGDDDWRW